MEALESLCRAVGYGGWGAVLLGVLCVMMAVLLGGRRECPQKGLPQQPEKTISYPAQKEAPRSWHGAGSSAQHGPLTICLQF